MSEPADSLRVIDRIDLPARDEEAIRPGSDNGPNHDLPSPCCVAGDEIDLADQENRVVVEAMRWTCRTLVGPARRHRRQFIKVLRAHYGAHLPVSTGSDHSPTPLSHDELEWVGAFRQLAAAGLNELIAQRRCQPELPVLDQVDLLTVLILLASDPPAQGGGGKRAQASLAESEGCKCDSVDALSPGETKESEAAVRSGRAVSQNTAIRSDVSAVSQIAADQPGGYVDWDVAVTPRPERTSANLDGDNARLAREHDVWRFLAGADLADPWTTCLPSARLIVEANTADGKGQQPLTLLPAASLTFGEQERLRHTLIIGPTGCGKSTRYMHAVLRSDIADRRKTVILLDSKGGEMLPIAEELAAVYRDGEPVRVLDFGNPANSCGWNPVQSLTSFAEVRGFAHRLCRATESRPGAPESEFWVTASTKLLAAVLWALRIDDEESCTLARAQQIVEWGVKDLRRWCEAHADVVGLQSFCEFLDSGSHNAHTILADLQNRLSLWHDENICRVTSRDELLLAEALSTPSIVVLRVNEADVSALKPLTNSFFSEIVSTLFRIVEKSPGGKLAVPVSLIIEEFASAVGQIPDFNRFINVVRSRGLSVTASVQSLSQIEFEYRNEAEPILAGFCSKVFFAGVSPNDAAYASSLFGAMTVEHREESYARDAIRAYDSSAYTGESIKIVPRAILTPHEIRRPVRHPELGEAVTFDLPGVPPFQAFLTPSYELQGFGALLGRIRDARKLGAPRSNEQPPLREGRGPAPVKLASGIHASKQLPQGITDTRGMTECKVRELLEKTKESLGFDGATGSARKWWHAFEAENKHRIALVLRLAEELKNRNATIKEFFLAYVYSNTDNIQANLYYLDYKRLMKEEEQKRRKAKRGATEPNCDDEEASSDG